MVILYEKVAESIYFYYKRAISVQLNLGITNKKYIKGVKYLT